MVEWLKFLKIAPAYQSMSDGEDFIDYIRRKLIGKSIKIAEEVNVPMLGHPVWFKVLEAEPIEGIFFEDTELVIEGLTPRMKNHEKLMELHLYWSKKPLYRSARASAKLHPSF